MTALTHATRTNLIKWPSILLALSLLGACAGGTKSIPMTIQSDPLGAHVIYQARTAKEGNTDWIYLGKTPLDIKQSIPKKQLKSAEAFRMRVMKDGYSDQIRDWTGNDLRDEIEEKGRLFWNPRMVPSS